MSKTAAFVVGDAAVTGPRGAGFATGDYSSFLEPHVSTQQHNIEERVLKIAPVGKRILGVSGNTRLCAEATRLFAKLPEQSAEEFFRTVEASLLPTPERLELLVAEPGRVVRWDSETLTRTSAHFVVIGTVPAKASDTLFKIAHSAFHLELEPKDFLAVLQGAYQSLVIRNGLMAEHVGGAVMGAFVDSSGTQWLSDTMFAMFDPKLMGDPHSPKLKIPDLHLVHLVARDRVAFAAPVLIDGKVGIKVLPGVDLTADDVKLVIASNRNELLETFARARAQHWVFVSRTGSLVMVMRGGVEVASGQVYLDKQIAAAAFALNPSLPAGSDEVTVIQGAPSSEGGLQVRFFGSAFHDQAMKHAGLVAPDSEP